MPIVISRKTGEILHMPKYTPEQIFKAQAAVVKYWAKTHRNLLENPEKLEEWLRQRRSITVDPALNGETKSTGREVENSGTILEHTP